MTPKKHGLGSIPSATFYTHIEVSGSGNPFAISDGKHIMFGTHRDYNSLTTCPKNDAGIQVESSVFIPDDMSAPYSHEIVESNLAAISQQSAKMIIEQVCDICPLQDLCPKKGIVFVASISDDRQDGL